MPLQPIPIRNINDAVKERHLDTSEIDAETFTVNDVADYFTETTIEAVLAEIYEGLDAHVTDTTNPHSVIASQVSNTLPYGSSVNVEDSLDIHDKLISTHNITGFPDRDHSTIAFDDTTRTFTITPVGTMTFYQGNEVYEKTVAETIVIPDTYGTHAIFYDDGVLTTSMDESILSLITDKVLVTYIVWDSVNAKRIGFDDERHGLMDSYTHYYEHVNEGTRYRSGLALSDILADENGSLDSHASIGVDGGTIQDEDLEHIIGALAKPAQIPVFYREGEQWRRDAPRDFPVKQGATLLAYNEITGTSGSQVELGNNDYVLAHIFATNDIDYPIVAFQGQNIYNSKGDARDGADIEINNLVVIGLPVIEWRAIGTLIYQSSSAYSNTPLARIITTEDGYDYIDHRTSTLKSTGSTSSTTTNASSVLTNTTNFDQLLSATDTDVQTALNTLDEIITSEERDQIRNIGTTTISPTQWSWFGADDQPVKTTDDVTHNSLTLTIPLADASVASNITLDNLTQITTRNHSDLQNIDGDTYHVLAATRSALQDVNAQLLNLQTDGSPTFVDLTLSGNDLVFGNGESISNVNDGYLDLTATYTRLSGDLMKQSSDLYINNWDDSADRTVYITNTNGTYKANLNVENEGYFGGKLTVAGDFEVLGTTTTINTETLAIEDNLTLYNSNQTGTPSSALIGGIEIERGDLTNYQFVFVELDDNFQVGEIGSLQAVATRPDSTALHNGGLAYWDSSSLWYETTSHLTWDGTNLDIAADNKYLRIGDGHDLRLYHSGTHSFINNITGQLEINAGTNFIVDLSEQVYIRDSDNGDATLFNLDTSARTLAIGTAADSITTTHNGEFKLNGNKLNLGTDNYHIITNNNNDSVITAADSYEDLWIYGSHGIGMWYTSDGISHTQVAKWESTALTMAASKNIILNGGSISDSSGSLSLNDAVDISGALTATSYGGITEANLVDKSATETIAGTWTFSIPLADGSIANNITLDNITQITTRNHSSLQNIGTSDHHTRYADSEAIAAVEGEATLDLSGDVDVSGHLTGKANYVKDYKKIGNMAKTGVVQWGTAANPDLDDWDESAQGTGCDLTVKSLLDGHKNVLDLSRPATVGADGRVSLSLTTATSVTFELQVGSSDVVQSNEWLFLNSGGNFFGNNIALNIRIVSSNLVVMHGDGAGGITTTTLTSSISNDILYKVKVIFDFDADTVSVYDNAGNLDVNAQPLYNDNNFDSVATLVVWSNYDAAYSTYLDGFGSTADGYTAGDNQIMFTDETEDYNIKGAWTFEQPLADGSIANALSLTQIPNQTTNGFIKTSGANGTLSIDTSTYLTAITGESLEDLSNVTITDNTSGEILKWNGSAWVNNTLAEAGISATGHTHSYISTALTSGNILVGNGSNVATATAMSGDISITNTGVTAYEGTVSITKGGTGLISYTTGDLIYASAANTLSALSIGTAGKVLSVNGTADGFSWVDVLSNPMGTNLLLGSNGIGNDGSALTFDTNENATFAANVTAGDGTGTPDGNGIFTVRAAEFAGIDCHSERTSGTANIGGLRFFNSAGSQVSSILGTVDGDFAIDTVTSFTTSDGKIIIGPSGWRDSSRATIKIETSTNDAAEIDLLNTNSGNNYGWQISSRTGTTPELAFYSNYNGTFKRTLNLRSNDGSYNVVIEGRSTWANGASTYPTIRGTHSDEWVMINNPHIPWLENGYSGYSGTSIGARIRFASNRTASNKWDIGALYGTTNTFSIQYAESDVLTLDSSQNATFGGNLYIPEYLYHSGDTNTYLRFTSDNIRAYTGGNSKLTLTTSYSRLDGAWRSNSTIYGNNTSSSQRSMYMSGVLDNYEIGYYSSTIRNKENVISLEDEEDMFMQLRPVQFNMKSDHALNYGFIAEEIYELYPFMTWENQEDPTLLDGFDHLQLIAVNTNQIQKLTKERDELKTRLERIEKELGL